jgi:hypothetical protein
VGSGGFFQTCLQYFTTFFRSCLIHLCNDLFRKGKI